MTAHEDLEPIATIRPGIGKCFLASYLDPDGEDEAVEAFTSLRRAQGWARECAADVWRIAYWRDEPITEGRMVTQKWIAYAERRPA